MIYKKICEILTDIFETDEDSITPETSLNNDLGADVQDLVEIVMMLEEEFGINTDDLELEEEVDTVADLEEFIERRL